MKKFMTILLRAILSGKFMMKYEIQHLESKPNNRDKAEDGPYSWWFWY